ncbi:MULTISPECIES: ester cyclase [Halorussus]|uniref:ester cyclase n=1 Tax=Halorussus TaxID=1070314 RepID=UPI0020A18637|nr:ester cyclase [Halorussus vallis]USZ74805.1 ester cyclase [Halorussus vallis]
MTDATTENERIARRVPEEIVTGRSFEANDAVFTRVEDGKTVERWLQPDTFGLLRQIGLVSAHGELPDELR